MKRSYIALLICDKTGYGAGHIKGMINARKIFVRKLEDRRPLGRQRRRWENNMTANRIQCYS
jgi:hypothetical protein